MTLGCTGTEVTAFTYHTEKSGFHVGQEGEFLLHDSYKRPIERVRGRILTLMEGKTSLYAMLRTENGIRPGRLI